MERDSLPYDLLAALFTYPVQGYLETLRACKASLDGFEGSALAKYATSGSPRLSGYLLGEKYLNGNAAALDVKHGRGRVVLIGFRPQWRGQSHAAYKFFFNALYVRE